MAGRKNGKKMPAVHAPVVDFMGFLHSVEDNSVTTEIYDHSKVKKGIQILDCISLQYAPNRLFEILFQYAGHRSCTQ
jgi:hypothetical protein